MPRGSSNLTYSEEAAELLAEPAGSFYSQRLIIVARAFLKMNDAYRRITCARTCVHVRRLQS